MPGETLAQEQLELEEEPRGCKAEETLDQFLAALGMHMMAVDTPLSSAEALFEGQKHHSCTTCSRYGSVCSPLPRFATGTERAAEHQEPGSRAVPQGYNLQVHFGDCKVAYSLLSWEHNSRTSMDWNHQRVGTVCHRMDAAAVVASVFDTGVFVAVVVVVQWPPVVQSVSAADKPGTQPSAAALVQVSVLSAYAAACPVLVLAGELSLGVALASLLKTSALHVPSPVSLEEPRI